METDIFYLLKHEVQWLMQGTAMLRSMKRKKKSSSGHLRCLDTTSDSLTQEAFGIDKQWPERDSI